MSDDLISRKALMEGRVENDPVRIAAMCAPTAFDKEKVLEELKAWAKAAKTAGVNSAHSGLDRKASEYYQESKAYLRAVEIVEKGGI